MTSKERVLKMLSGEKVSPVPCFSGVGNVTSAGLEKLGYKFANVHNNAQQMAESAMTTWELYGYECVIVPFDLCMEAEVLGCEMNPYQDSSELLYPTIKTKSAPTAEQIKAIAAEGVSDKGRLPLIREAVKIIKEKVGDDVAIGSYLLGPFTLGGQISELEPLLKSAYKKPDEILEYLNALADVSIAIGNDLMDNGVDFISVREMGATTDVLSPKIFKKIISGPLKKVSAELKSPNILHICGLVTPILSTMVECGFDAISIDSKTPMATAREKLGPDTVILGNFNPFAILNNGEASEAYDTVAQIIKEGVSGVHPGCDIWPTAKPENIEAMMRACKETEVSSA